jgi:hypothetical protein
MHARRNALWNAKNPHSGAQKEDFKSEVKTRKKDFDCEATVRKRTREHLRIPLMRRTYFSRNRMTALQVSPGSPASRSSCVGQRGAHPH